MIPRPIGFVSPRIARLEHDLRSQGARAIAQFWSEVARHGAPLIEPGTRSGHSLVTFLWKADTPVEHVIIVSELLHGWWWNNYSDSRLIRLADSNVYYRTFQVPNTLRCLYRLAPDMPLKHVADVAEIGALLESAVADPLNPHTERDWTVRSVLALPDAPPDEWSQLRPSVRSGTLIDCSHIFSGLPASQKTKLYLPDMAQSGSAIEHLLVQYDVDVSVDDVRMPVIADNLLAAGKIPPVAMLFIDPSDDRAMSLNYSPDVARVIAREVVPWVRETYDLSLNPAYTVISGFSLGGSMALFTGLMHPNVFGVVVSISGGFMYSPAQAITMSDFDDALADDVGAEWLVGRIADSAAVPIRVSIAAGTLEHKRDGTFLNVLPTNRHLRTVLQLKGYDVRYREFCGGHQYIEVRSMLPDALVWALGR